jgi:hypothetical protein
MQYNQKKGKVGGQIANLSSLCDTGRLRSNFEDLTQSPPISDEKIELRLEGGMISCAFRLADVGMVIQPPPVGVGTSLRVIGKPARLEGEEKRGERSGGEVDAAELGCDCSDRSHSGWLGDETCFRRRRLWTKSGRWL